MEIATQIAIGGRIPRAIIPALCSLIEEEQCLFDWTRTAAPTNETDLLDELDANGHLVLTDPDRRWGNFDALEPFLEEYQIPYDKHCDACHEISPELTSYRPATGKDSFASDGAGNIMVRLEAVKAALDLLHSGRVEEALSALRALVPEIEPLPRLEFTDDLVPEDMMPSE